MTVLDGFLEAAVRGATPLAFAAAGELCAERAGVMNLGLEGVMAVGALAAYATAMHVGGMAGLAAGGMAGMAVAACFAVFILVLRAQQIIAGMAISMLGMGVAATLHRAWLARAGDLMPVATIPDVHLPLLNDVPVVGPALLSQPLPAYVLYLLFPAVAWMLYRTNAGNMLRAVGEFPAAVRASGHDPRLIQGAAILAGGFLAGVGGATLVVAQTGTFSDTMTAGRGYIAIAIVALGRWRPAGVALGSLLFGAVSALQFLAQSFGWPVPYSLVLGAPYLVTLAALILFRGSRVAPASLGRALETVS